MRGKKFFKETIAGRTPLGFDLNIFRVEYSRSTIRCRKKNDAFLNLVFLGVGDLAERISVLIVSLSFSALYTFRERDDCIGIYLGLSKSRRLAIQSRHIIVQGVRGIRSFLFSLFL